MVVGEVREALLGNLPWSDLRGKIEYAINLSTDISRIFKYEREHTDEKNNSLYEIFINKARTHRNWLSHRLTVLDVVHVILFGAVQGHC